MSGVDGFESYVREAAHNGLLIVQPRMGFGRLDEMQAGLWAVKAADYAAPRIGTVTIDAYTRVGHPEKATEALRDGRSLNGYPIVSHGAKATLRMLDGLRDFSFPVQVRHGTPFPQAIFEAAAAAGFDAIEGGPISYNFPYSRVPLACTIDAWAASSRFWAEYGERENIAAHLESFGGCMFGQLCPPGLLVALSILEALFFVENGIANVSLSLAQGTNDTQDVGAVVALRRLAGHYLAGVSWHIVYYSFMGLFPQTEIGAEAIIRASARIAVQGGAQRLIVKTAAEARGIPTIEQNLQALHWAREEADTALRDVDPESIAWADEICAEAEALISATKSRGASVAQGLLAAFSEGVLDVPFCAHPDNRNQARPTIHPETKALIWGDAGAMPIPARARDGAIRYRTLNAELFHEFLETNRRRYDLNPINPASRRAHD